MRQPEGRDEREVFRRRGDRARGEAARVVPRARAGEGDGGALKARNIATLRVLHVLSEFALDQPSFGVTELSRALGMTKNMVHRALATLVDQGYLVREDGGSRYELGFGVLALQNPHFPPPDFRTLAGPCLQALHRITKGTAQLAIRAGPDHQISIDGIEGYGLIALRTKIGVLIPLHASAASRAILSALPDEEVEAYLARNAPLQRFTPNTLTDPAAVRAEVRAVRDRGYAEGFGDHNRGGYSLSFPVLGANGLPHGAITVGGPLQSFTRERAGEFLPAVEAEVAALRRQAALYEAS